MKLHETIKNFYIRKLRPIFSVEVLGQNGRWNSVKSFNITEKQFFYRVKTENTELLCTENHILIDENDEEVLAVKALNKKIKTVNGVEKVIAVQKTDIYDNAYDLSLAENTDHLYYADKMLSHNCVICDEFAFLQKNLADKLFTSMFPVISSSKNGKFIIVSTPNGTDNLYYDIWQKANSKDKGKNLDGWKAFTMWWWQVPGHDEAWKARQIEAIGATRFAQEFNNEFLANSTSRKLIADDIIEKYRMRLSDYRNRGVKPKTQRVVSEREDRLYEFEMWHEFDPKRAYLASCDIAEGIGGDASVLYVWDVTETRNIRMCAKFSSNRVSLVEFAYICSKILPVYGNPFLFGERNGLSAGFMDSLRITYGYQNIACESKNGEAGIYSHVSVKLRACLWAREMMTTDGFGFTIYDKDLVDEMSVFVKRDGSRGQKSDKTMYAALPPAHDDHIMSFIWACWGLSQELVDKYFVVADRFTNLYEQIMPKIVQPLNAYDPATLRRITDDPIYQDFLDFKEKLTKRCRELGAQFDRTDEDDSFRYGGNAPDPYFGGYGEAEWGSPWDARPVRQNADPRTQSCSPNNMMPSYFI